VIIKKVGYAVAQLVVALPYKPKVAGFLIDLNVLTALWP
jgi:hypothetical protein